MSASDAAAYALVHTLAGLSVGLSIHALIPGPVHDETLQETVSYVALQSLMNGMAVYVSTQVLDGQNDPTAGILFIWALMSSQPGFTGRLKALSVAAELRVSNMPWPGAGRALPHQVAEPSPVA